MQQAFKNHTPEDRANQIAEEYKDFAYIVSHDLSAPLRHVKEFTKLLIGGCKENLSEEEQEYVEFLEQSLKKLDNMQAALLTFSRLNTRAGPAREIDFNHAVTDALKDLDDLVTLYQPSFECGELPALTAEPRQIKMLFFHLIDNALKFHEPDTSKRKISITASDQDDMWLFEVRDNGIGIDEKYHDEVLRLFRRLNPEKYTGIGAGLTIAHKIVQRHGGEMIIESRPGKGTSVFFSIPEL